MSDPFGGGFGFGFDPSRFENAPFFRELAKVMSWQGGPVNWELASQTASTVLEEADRTASVGQELASAVPTAELWLDQVTALPSVAGPTEPLSRSGWTQLAATPQGLGRYVEPLAEGATEALGQQLREQLPEALREQMGGMGGDPMQQMMGSMGAMLYGMQAGLITGHLAGQLLATSDLGVPTVDPNRIGTVGAGADRFAEDYGVEQREMGHWLALHEAAHRRLFAGVSWLADHVSALIREFAAGADIDPSRLMEQLGGAGMDPSDPEALQRALEQPDAFHVEPTPQQREVLDRLQALISFTEAWSETVVRTAAEGRLPSLPRIEEARRRQRAEQGPGERFLSQLVGLDLTPSDVRLAGAFCEAVIEARGQEGLDRAWEDPECLPSRPELADPSQWLVRMAARELGIGPGDG